MPDFSVTTSNFSADDVTTAKFLLIMENERRAALDPPEDPLPMETNAEAKASLETLLSTGTLPNAWVSYTSQAAEARLSEKEIREKYKSLTDAEKTQVETLIDSLSSN
jgi:hypothetical protein